MISLLLTSLVAMAQSPAPQQTPFQACVQTCQAWSQPGYELRSCVARCQAEEDKRAEAEGELSFRESELHALRCQYEPSLCQ